MRNSLCHRMCLFFFPSSLRENRCTCVSWEYYCFERSEKKERSPTSPGSGYGFRCQIRSHHVSPDLALPDTILSAHNLCPDPGTHAKCHENPPALCRRCAASALQDPIPCGRSAHKPCRYNCRPPRGSTENTGRSQRYDPGQNPGSP